MALETKEKQIGEHIVLVTTLTATRAVKLQVKLVKLLGPSFGALFSSLDLKKIKAGKFTESDIKLEMISTAFEKLSDKLDPDEFDALLFQILANTKVDGKDVSSAVVFNSVFTGELMLMYRVLLFSLEVQFSNFFEESGIGTLLKSVKKKQETQEPQKSEQSLTE